MDTINEELPPAASGGFVLSTFAVADLLKTAKWANFLAIIGFIFTGIMAIAAFSIGTLFTTMMAGTPVGLIIGGMGVTVTIFYLIVAAICFILNLFLYQFAARTQKAFIHDDSSLLDSGIHRLQSYFKMIGIMVIIELGLFVLCIIATIAFGAFMQHSLAH